MLIRDKIPSIGVCVSGIYAAYMGLRGAEGETIGRKGWMTYRKVSYISASDIVQ